MFAPRPPNSLTFRLLAACLEYPTDALIGALDEARELVRSERALRGETREHLLRFLDYLGSRDLLSLQENYVALFDRGRATSLHLFEHVHGESRDRGQAMIDLKQMYEGHGLLLGPEQLPDYLPVFLEYLSILEAGEARSLLGETVAILEAITAELNRRNSHYAYVTGAVLALAGNTGAELPEDAHDDDANAPHDSQDLDALDAAWTEEPVKFMGNTQPAVAPVEFHARRPSR
ncbi:Nitrate reductase molybdenum cofactor assembly chaperone NarJ [Paraburkholderia caffeinitolerans]|uniref:Nitrate reductase molybdenum cofactor assembly chaperone NarJ n=1 Tax=Paraburkholderia caffeinitolerans TaxID=1723730 RepID=A0A6J5H403_9BURK|nr:nitrate reductase molybdenum cofactor assembly chaperone [Paraburkholderia caffeinitolerans]CAB3810351.1 Nitrate reductase molybdenum cofactor assembly chaperone NarJ [Paraburkholderia caffeinitolerans]